MTLRECSLQLLVPVESPSVHAIADDEIEVIGRKVLLELFQRGDDMLLSPVTRSLRVRLDRPEVLARKITLLVVRGVGTAPDEQHPFDTRIAGVVREYLLFHDQAVCGVEGGRHA